WPRSYAARDSSAPTRGLDLWRNRPNAVRRGGQAPFARTFRRRGPSLLRPAVSALRQQRPASRGADGEDGNPAARVTTTGRGRCARNISHSVLLLISAPDLDSGALSVSEMASPRAPHTRSEWSLDWGPAGAVGKCQLVSCPQHVVVAAAQLVGSHRWTEHRG